jgi:hypothetical protein
VNGTQDDTPPTVRPRAIRAAWVAALVAGGCLLCWGTIRVEQSLSTPAVMPGSIEVTLDVVVTDADTGEAVSGAEVGIDQETGDMKAPGPTWKGITDERGVVRLVHDFDANTVLGKDGRVRGMVVFGSGSPPLNSWYLLAIRASGNREQSISLVDQFPRGIAYEDPSPRTIRVRLSPRPAR